MSSDLRFAFRSLRKTPGFAVTAVLIMAVAIGACTTVFSLLQAVILRPLPYPNAHALYNVWSVYSARSLETATGGQKYDSLLEERDIFTDAAILTTPFLLTYRYGAADPQMAPARFTSINLLSLFGVGPIKGRDFTWREGETRAPVVMIGYSLWRKRFGQDPNVIGQSILVDGVAREIIGVLPPSMQVAFKDMDLLIPSRVPAAVPAEIRRKKSMAVTAPSHVIVRLAPNATLRAANARLAEISRRYRADTPWGQDADSENILRSLQQDLLGESSRTLRLLAAAVVAVMLIACANVANLLLARVSNGWRDIVVRFALGAGRRAVLRQFFTEGALLAFASAASGILLGWLGLRSAIALAGDHLPRANEVHLDATALFVSVALSVLASLLSYLYPAWVAARMDLQSGLKAGPGTTAGGAGRIFREGLVVAQVGLSLVLLCCAGLLVASLYRLLGEDMGFAAENRAVGSVTLPSSGRYGTVEAANAFYSRLENALEQAPEFAAAGAASGLPLSGAGIHLPITVEGRSTPPSENDLSATIRWATPGYFPAMGARLREGRLFTRADRPRTAAVAIVNETFAKRVFPDGSAIGKRVGVMGSLGAVIVGVVHDLKTDIAAPVVNEVYIARDQLTMNVPGMSIVVRGQPGIKAEGLIPAMRRVLKTVDSEITLHDPRTMSAVIGETVQLRRLAMTLLLVLSGVAVLLAVVGLYAVVAYAVSRRTAEIGVRMALGAQRPHIVSLVVSRGVWLVAMGLALGLLVAGWSTRLMGSMLYRVEPLDPLIIGFAALLFGVVATCACLLPSLQASRIDPLMALRTE